MGAGPRAEEIRRALHVACLIALAAWIALAVPRFTPGLRLAGSIALAAAVAHDVASERHDWTRRIVFGLSIATYLVWVVVPTSPLSRPVVQTVIEAVVVVAVIESRNLVALPLLLVALVMVGLVEAGQIYDPNRFERMLWLAQAWLFVLATLVQRIRA